MFASFIAVAHITDYPNPKVRVDYNLCLKADSTIVLAYFVLRYFEKKLLPETQNYIRKVTERMNDFDKWMK